MNHINKAPTHPYEYNNNSGIHENNHSLCANAHPLPWTTSNLTLGIYLCIHNTIRIGIWTDMSEKAERKRASERTIYRENSRETWPIGLYFHPNTCRHTDTNLENTAQQLSPSFQYELSGGCGYMPLAKTFNSNIRSKTRSWKSPVNIYITLVHAILLDVLWFRS